MLLSFKCAKYYLRNQNKLTGRGTLGTNYAGVFIGKPPLTLKLQKKSIMLEASFWPLSKSRSIEEYET